MCAPQKYVHALFFYSLCMFHALTFMGEKNKWQIVILHLVHQCFLFNGMCEHVSLVHIKYVL